MILNKLGIFERYLFSPRGGRFGGIGSDGEPIEEIGDMDYEEPVVPEPTVSTVLPEVQAEDLNSDSNLNAGDNQSSEYYISPDSAPVQQEPLQEYTEQATDYVQPANNSGFMNWAIIPEVDQQVLMESLGNIASNLPEGFSVASTTIDENLMAQVAPAGSELGNNSVAVEAKVAVQVIDQVVEDEATDQSDQSASPQNQAELQVAGETSANEAEDSSQEQSNPVGNGNVAINGDHRDPADYSAGAGAHSATDLRAGNHDAGKVVVGVERRGGPTDLEIFEVKAGQQIASTVVSNVITNALKDGPNDHLSNEERATVSGAAAFGGALAADILNGGDLNLERDAIAGVSAFVSSEVRDLTRDFVGNDVAGFIGSVAGRVICEGELNGEMVVDAAKGYAIDKVEHIVADQLASNLGITAATEGFSAISSLTTVDMSSIGMGSVDLSGAVSSLVCGAIGLKAESKEEALAMNVCSTIGNYIFPVVGGIIGSVVGKFIGSLFGDDDPPPMRTAHFDSDSNSVGSIDAQSKLGHFGFDTTDHCGEGEKKYLQNFANAVAKTDDMVVNGAHLTAAQLAEAQDNVNKYDVGSVNLGQQGQKIETPTGQLLTERYSEVLKVVDERVGAICALGASKEMSIASTNINTTVKLAAYVNAGKVSDAQLDSALAKAEESFCLHNLRFDPNTERWVGQKGINIHGDNAEIFQQAIANNENDPAMISKMNNAMKGHVWH